MENQHQFMVVDLSYLSPDVLTVKGDSHPRNLNFASVFLHLVEDMPWLMSTLTLD